MKYLNIFLLILALVFFVSCEGDTSKTSSESETSVPSDSMTDKTEEPSTDNWLIIPGQQVGRIKADFSAQDIYKMFGEENVAEAEIGLGEGETTTGLLIFPKTKNELQVLFTDGQKMEKIDRIKILGEEGMWKTKSGILAGTTLEELEKINGKPFTFTGFEWDYAGRLMSWNGGKINDSLIIYLTATNEEAVFPDLIGDIEISSDHPKAKAAGLKVTSMEVTF